MKNAPVTDNGGIVNVLKTVPQLEVSIILTEYEALYNKVLGAPSVPTLLTTKLKLSADPTIFFAQK